jgi:hypothetical protein
MRNASMAQCVQCQTFDARSWHVLLFLSSIRPKSPMNMAASAFSPRVVNISYGWRSRWEGRNSLGALSALPLPYLCPSHAYKTNRELLRQEKRPADIHHIILYIIFVDPSSSTRFRSTRFIEKNIILGPLKRPPYIQIELFYLTRSSLYRLCRANFYQYSHELFQFLGDLQ